LIPIQNLTHIYYTTLQLRFEAGEIQNNKIQVSSINNQENPKLQAPNFKQIPNPQRYRSSAHPEAADEGSPCGSLKSLLAFLRKQESIPLPVSHSIRFVKNDILKIIRPLI
jgi:hypothetical protein